MRCTIPPPGWRCTRKAPHDGPCAAVPTRLPKGPAEIRDHMLQVFCLTNIRDAVRTKAQSCAYLAIEQAGTANERNWSGLADELNDVADMIQLHIDADEQS